MRRALFVFGFAVLAACGGKELGVDLTSSSSSGSSGGSSGSSGSSSSSGGSSSGGSSSGASGSSSSSSSGSSGGGCDGTTLKSCTADGAIHTSCCPKNADCAQPPPYCDLGGGKCTAGECWPTPCSDKTCNPGEVCVVTTTVGGACFMPGPDGTCPDGSKVPPGSCCTSSSTSYACQPLPAKCGSTLACPCAESLCQCGGCALGAQKNTLDCACYAP